MTLICIAFYQSGSIWNSRSCWTKSKFVCVFASKYVAVICHDASNNVTFAGGERSARLERRCGECVFTNVYFSGHCSQS